MVLVILGFVCVGKYFSFCGIFCDYGIVCMWWRVFGDESVGVSVLGESWRGRCWVC